MPHIVLRVWYHTAGSPWFSSQPITVHGLQSVSSGLTRLAGVLENASWSRGAGAVRLVTWARELSGLLGPGQERFGLLEFFLKKKNDFLPAYPIRQGASIVGCCEVLTNALAKRIGEICAWKWRKDVQTYWPLSSSALRRNCRPSCSVLLYFPHSGHRSARWPFAVSKKSHLRPSNTLSVVFFNSQAHKGPERSEFETSGERVLTPAGHIILYRGFAGQIVLWP